MDFSTQYPNLNFPEGPANSSTLTKQHFVEILYDRLGLSRQEATQVIESIFSEIELALLDGRDVKLANFGTFSTRDKVARPGRNPKTGEEHEICARRVATLVPAPHLRDSVASFVDREAQKPAAE